MPQPVLRISRVSALSSPLVSLRNSMFGMAATITPPFANVSEVARLILSANTVTLSALPSPLVSSRILIMSSPGRPFLTLFG